MIFALELKPHAWSENDVCQTNGW